MGVHAQCPSRTRYTCALYKGLDGNNGMTKAWRDVIEDRVVTLTRVMNEASLLVNLHFARVIGKWQRGFAKFHCS